MHAFYIYLPDQELLVTSYGGAVDPTVSQQMRIARAADPIRARVRAHVIDFSGLEGTTTSVSAEAAIYRAGATDYARVFGALQTAVIATSPHVFGLARIFEIVGGLEVPSVPIRVVASWGDASSFLGIDLDDARGTVDRMVGRHQPDS